MGENTGVRREAPQGVEEEDAGVGEGTAKVDEEDAAVGEVAAGVHALGGKAVRVCLRPWCVMP